MAENEVIVPNNDIEITFHSTGVYGWTEVDELLTNPNTNDNIYCGTKDKVAFFDLSSPGDDVFEKITDAMIEIACDSVTYDQIAAIRVLLYNDSQLLFSKLVKVPTTISQPASPLKVIYFIISTLNVPYEDRSKFSIYIESEFADLHTQEPDIH